MIGVTIYVSGKKTKKDSLLEIIPSKWGLIICILFISFPVPIRVFYGTYKDGKNDL